MILDAIKERYSCRAFLNQPVTQEQLVELLTLARQAPSGSNTQPWRVFVLNASARHIIAEGCIAARERGEPPRPDYLYYPQHWSEPYRTRRQICGQALYQALGIERHDQAARKAAWYRNYHFFDAPVALILALPQDLETGSFLDTGMFIQTLLLASQAMGLGSCAQAALAEYPDIVRQALQQDTDLKIICGVALGYPDTQAPVNQYRTERAPLEDFVTFLPE